jgi:uncharacterized protein YkwD
MLDKRLTAVFTRILVVVLLCAVPGYAGNFFRAAYLSDLENDIVRELSLARTDPAQYALFVEEWGQYYDGKLRKLPGRVPIKTKEGLRAVREATRFLESVEPLPGLRLSKGMSRGARDHVRGMGPSGATGHKGRDGSNTGDRVNRYGKWQKRVGENIAYGGGAGRELVIRLIIDDGVRGRGHRKNIFDPEFLVVGVASGPHDKYGTMSVITFAGDYLE